jgi:hypothetical protein
MQTSKSSSISQGRHHRPLLSVQRKMEAAAMKRDAKFQVMLQSVMDGLEGQEGILKEIKELVAEEDRARERRQKELHEASN